MQLARLSLAVAGMAVSVAMGAALWPHARGAYDVLAAQDDPAQLADLNINSALRNNQALIEQNIEAALAAGDADLANSFVELAREKNDPAILRLDLFACPTRDTCDSTQVDGRRLRFDGLHYRDAAARLASQWILDQLVQPAA